MTVSRQFGHGLRALWPLAAGTIYLNHGTVGVTPKPVLEAQDGWRERMERHPARFMLRELKPALRTAADRAAALFGGRGDDYVFVENATTGVNAVLRSTELGPGDEVLVTDHTYGAVRNAAAYACRRAGATLVTAEMPFPIAGPEAALTALEVALGPRTRLAILDHVTSDTALLLPLQQMIAACHAAGARVLVDGAHAPGQIDLDIPATGADWYAANLHKWQFAPRGCGLLWAGPAAQENLHPAVISWRLDEGFTAEFDWTGTRDPTAYLSFPAAADFMATLGATAVREHNHALVRQAAELFAARFDGPLAPAAMSGAMALAPLPAKLAATAEAAQALRDHLLDDHDIEVPVLAWSGRLWARLSAQVYCEVSDFERLADAVAAWTQEE